MDLQSTVNNVISRQDGVISLEQAKFWGMTQGQVRHRVDRGSWVRLYPGVYASSTHRLTSAGRLRAAAFWAGENSLLSSVAAAWWWGMLERPPRDWEFSIAWDQRRRPPPGIVIKRRTIDRKDRGNHDNVAITSRALTVLMAAVILGPAGRSMVDRALQTGTTVDELHAAYQRNKGLHGAPAMRKLLSLLDGSAAESERLFIRLLRGAGITGWVINRRLSGETTSPDFTFAGARLIVEIDGWAWHHTPDRFQRDRARQNKLVLGGWMVLRFTWADLTERPDWVITQVRRALAR